jgi:hypothetical protein
MPCCLMRCPALPKLTVCPLPLVNHARAMRVAEIMNDFRNIQFSIASLQANPSPEEYYLEGYALLRQCVAEAHSLLTQEYAHSPQHPGGDAEAEKSLLKL